MRIFSAFRAILDRPLQVTLVTLAFCLTSLLWDGSLINYFSLKSEKQRLESEYKKTISSNSLLQRKIAQASGSVQFIGRQAREKLDLVSEDELVFIFE